MLHQLIFAAPKPGMSEREFQDYWVHTHAVQYASKIPQIRRYSVNTRIACGPEPQTAPFSGCAEIWLDDVDALLAALQSDAFVNGARADEPRWAAFWQTVCLNTETSEALPGPPMRRDDTMVKMYVLVKRKPGMSMAEFRRYSLDVHAPKVLRVPGLRRYHQCINPDAFYATGETPLDGASILWFDDVTSVETALRSPELVEYVQPDTLNFTDPKYTTVMVAEEHWIIGPENREESLP